jgi:hypothetical protein
MTVLVSSNTQDLVSERFKMLKKKICSVMLELSELAFELSENTYNWFLDLNKMLEHVWNFNEILFDISQTYTQCNEIIGVDNDTNLDFNIIENLIEIC